MYCKIHCSHLIPLVDEDQEITIRPVPAMMVDDDNQRMKEMTAILEDRVNCK